MNKNNYDAEQMYKEYLNDVSADRSAIEDILSGEREAANYGAKIKHSPGKLATLTAAAAVVAVCAGIGLSNLNENDVDSKSAASKPETTVVTTADQTKQNSTVTPAKQQDNFKTEVTGMYASDHGLRVFVKCTALTDEGKKLIKEADEALKNQKPCQLSVSGVNNTDKFAGVAEKKLEINGDYFTTELTYQAKGSNYIFKDGTKLSIRVVTPAEQSDEKLVPSDRTVEFTIKKNMTERVFKSESGKTLWLSDFQFNCNVDYQKLDKNAMSNFEMIFADSTVKTPKNLLCCGGSGTPGENGDPNAMIAFLDKIDSSKVTSIKYAGEIFVTQQALFKPEMTEMHCSDHSLRATVKLTALNAEAQKVLDAEAAKYKNNSGELGDITITPIVGNNHLGVGQSTPTINGNTLTSTLLFNDSIYYNGILKSDHTIDIIFSLSSQELNDISLIPADRHLTISVNKNMTERVFKSENGNTLWLHDYGFSVDMDSKGMDKYTYNNFEMTFEDGTVKTPFNMQMASHGGYKFINFGFKDKIDSSKVTSIKYAGKTFTAQ